MNRKKLTKNQFLAEISTYEKSNNTQNAYDLNETGGFINDKKKDHNKLYPFL